VKRMVLVVLISVLAGLPALASGRLLNLGYNIQTDGDSKFSRQSIGLVYTCLKGGNSGFYSQVAPYYALSWKSGGALYKYSDWETVGAGLTFTLGYGKDLNFGKFGVLVGGGFFGNLYAQYNSYWDYLYYNAAAGVGGGAHAYFQPGAGSFVINLGLDAAWRPLEGYGYTDTGFGEFLFEMGDFNFNLNAGIGWRY